MTSLMLDPAAAYAERLVGEATGLDAVAAALSGGLRHRLPYRWAAPTAAVARAGRLAEEVATWSDDELRRRLPRAARAALGLTSTPRAAPTDGLALGLALVREASTRSLGLRPYDCQLTGAALLLRGCLAEMQTGEGKTLTAALAATLAASAGLPVHVVTVNDYLAERDAAKLAPLLHFLGLQGGTVLTGMPAETRRRAYACNVTHVTGKELVFDYLKDKVAAGAGGSALQSRLAGWIEGQGGSGRLLRGLHLAIVDEADSIFIDEARTPLILSVTASGQPQVDAGTCAQALHLARALEAGTHYRLRLAARELHLSDAGRDALADAAQSLGPAWRLRPLREHLVAQALRAQHLFHRDRHYIVKDEQVLIVDEQTGRAMPGRSWEADLHQLIETKEGLPLSDPVRTVARITYQRFFRRYLRLCGMTGTAREVRAELWRVYRLPTVSVPTHRPARRQVLPARCLARADDRWQAVCDATVQQLAVGRPVLVGTRSVQASMAVAAALSERGIAHRLLNARQDAGEAALVETAGQPGMVTVATNMAGRGTDIALGSGVPQAGGLHVILTEFHESRRVDRQLFGRAARQGDPGSAQALVSLDDELLRHHGGAWRWLVRLCPERWTHLHALAAALMRRRCQRRTEGQHALERRSAMRHDDESERMLSFSGRN